MSTLTIEFRGVTEEVLNALIERGYAKTKSEAVRYALLHVGQEMNLFSLHEKAENYAYEDITQRLRRMRK